MAPGRDGVKRSAPLSPRFVKQLGANWLSVFWPDGPGTYTVVFQCQQRGKTPIRSKPLSWVVTGVH